MSKKGIGRGLGKRQFAVERLEARTMMAVDVTKSGNNLKIVGTNDSELVAIVQVASQTYVVVGLNGTDLKGTTETLPGTTNEFKVLSGIKGNFDVDLKGGSDFLGIGNDIDSLADKASDAGFSISNVCELTSGLEYEFSGYGSSEQLTVPVDLLIKMGTGSLDGVAIIADVGDDAIIDLGDGYNYLNIDPTYIDDDLIITGGKNNDEVILADTHVKDVLSVNLKDGYNSLEVADTCDEGNSRVGGSAIYRGGKEDDYVSFYNTTIGNDLDVNLGDGSCNELCVRSGDKTEVQTVISDDVIVNSGKGRDDIKFYDVLIKDVLNVSTRDGNDDVSFERGGTVEEVSEVGVRGSAIINTGAGHDEVEINGNYEASSFGVRIGLDLIINTLGGKANNDNDTVLVCDTRVGDDLIVNTGEGEDGVQIGGCSECEHDDYPEETSSDFVEETWVEASTADVYVGGNLVVDLGNGNDGDLDTLESLEESSEVDLGLALTDVYVKNDAIIDLGNGHDSFRATGCYVADDAVINAGSGDDFVSISYCKVVDVLTAQMAAGLEDYLGIFDSRARVAVLRADKTNDFDTLELNNNVIDVFSDVELVNKLFELNNL